MFSSFDQHPFTEPDARGGLPGIRHAFDISRSRRINVRQWLIIRFRAGRRSGAGPCSISGAPGVFRPLDHCRMGVLRLHFAAVRVIQISGARLRWIAPCIRQARVGRCNRLLHAVLKMDWDTDPLAIRNNAAVIVEVYDFAATVDELFTLVLIPYLLNGWPQSSSGSLCSMNSSGSRGAFFRTGMYADLMRRSKTLIISDIGMLLSMMFRS